MSSNTFKFNNNNNNNKNKESQYYESTFKRKENTEKEKKLDENDFPSLKPATEKTMLINEKYTKKNTNILNFLAAAKKVPEQEPEQEQQQADEVDIISLNDDVFRRHYDEESDSE